MSQQSKTISLALVSYELAVMLKECGFEQATNHYYVEFSSADSEEKKDDFALCTTMPSDSEYAWKVLECSESVQRYLDNFGDDNTASGMIYSAPELALVQQWLLSKFNIYIAPVPGTDFGYWKCRLYYPDGFENVTGTYKTESQALQVGITHCLTKIKEKK